MSGFSTIVADPPWKYPNGLWQRRKSRASSHYPLMTLKEIEDLPVELMALDNCALWLWIPTHHLIRGYGARVVEAWGFRPITTMQWLKPQMGLGKYIRNSHEQVVFAVRGKYELKVKNLKSYFTANRRKHSQKPEEFHEIVERSCHGPYLELFAREKWRPGWSYWGNEIESDINLEGENGNTEEGNQTGGAEGGDPHVPDRTVERNDPHHDPGGLEGDLRPDGSWVEVGA